MIGSTDETMYLGRVEVGHELVVRIVAPLGGFHEDELHGETPLTGLLQHPPVDVTLIVRDVDAMHRIAMRHADSVALQPVARLPSVGIRTDEEKIETADEDKDNQHTEEIPNPCRHLLLYFLLPFPLGRSALNIRLHRRLSGISCLRRFLFYHSSFTWKPSPIPHRCPDFPRPDRP